MKDSSKSYISPDQFLKMDIIENILMRSGNPAEVSRYVVEIIRELIGSRAVILIRAADFEDFYVEDVYPHRRIHEFSEIHLKELCQYCVELRKTGVIIDKQSSGFESEILQKLSIDTVICISLVSSDELGGFLILADLFETEMYKMNSVLQTLESISVLLAMLYKNAILYKNLERIVQKRTHELLFEKQELEKSRYQLQATFDCVSNAVISVDLYGRVYLANQKACALFETDFSDMPDFHSFLNINDYETGLSSVLMVEAVLNTGIPAKIEHGIMNNDEKHVSFSAVSMQADGKVFGAVITIDDITERIRLEEKLRQSQKMEAIGQLAGGIAHDFNNALMGILGSSELIREKTQDSVIEKHAAVIMRAATGAAELTGKMLAFSRKSEISKTTCSVNQIISDVGEILSHSLNKNILLHLCPSSEFLYCICNYAEIENVVLNIAINARDSMITEGELILKTSAEKIEIPVFNRFGFSIIPGNYVKISVRDTGIGIPEGIQEKIFEPFFTTKEKGKGTGLGLAAAYGAIIRHEGLMDFISSSDGTEFFILLPSAEKSEEVVEKTHQQKSFQHFLIVDDEELVRSTLKEMLEYIGGSVQCADCGESCLEKLKENNGNFDLIILDMMMPGIGGMETLKKAKECYPDIQILVSSGYSEDATEEDVLRHGAAGFLHKPYKMAELRKLMNLL